MYQLHPELDNVLGCLSSNGYSIFSLIDEILVRCNWEDDRINVLREGIERDAADICARLLCHITSGPLKVMKFGKVHFKIHRHTVPIDVLPDNVLLEIFKFCLCDVTSFSKYSYDHAKKWQTLVHVCQKWRNIIFASPRQLELHLTCSYRTPVRKNLGFWPVTLPLSLDYSFCRNPTPDDVDNAVAALEYPGRVHSIDIQDAGASLMKKVVTAMQKPFPSLVNLDLLYRSDSFRAIPKKFLGGSAPSLQHLSLSSIFPTHLPTLLLTARNLVTLALYHILPLNDYLPESLARLLAALPRLTDFSTSCDVDMPLDQWQSPPDPSMRVILPALTCLDYSGHSMYLEDFLAQVDMPRVYSITIEYAMHQIQVSQLSRFLERTQSFKIDYFTRVEVVFYHEDPYFVFDHPEGKSYLSMQMLDEARAPLEVQVRVMVHVLHQLAPIFFNVDVLYVRGFYVQRQSNQMDITEWLPMFRLFPTIGVLRLSGGAGVNIASALENTSEEMVTEVLPALRIIKLAKNELDNDEEVSEMDQDYWNESGALIERFPFLRQFSGCPITVLSQEEEFVEAEWRQ